MAVSTTTTATPVKTGNSNTTSGAVSEPASTAQGNALIAVALTDASVSNTLTRPAGWSALPVIVSNGESLEGQFCYDFSYVIRGASPPTSMTWTWTQEGAGNAYYEVHILRVFSDDGGTITLDAISAAVNSQFSGAADPPAVTVITANSLAVALVANWSGSAAGGWGAPTNYTVRTTNTNGLDGVIIARTALIGAGAENPGTLTNVSDTGPNTVSVTVAFNQTGGGGGRTTKNTQAAPLGADLGMGLWMGG